MGGPLRSAKITEFNRGGVHESRGIVILHEFIEPLCFALPATIFQKLLPNKKQRCTFAGRKKRVQKFLSAMDAISFIHEQVTKETNLPAFRAGDTVVVDYRITEGDKSRIQQFRGDVIQIKGEGLTKTFTVRKISNGVGVERIFPLSSPAIDGLTIIKHGKVRRSRLFYLRDRVGKKARIKERRIK